MNATFTYTGSSATRTNATITYNVNASNWKLTSSTATKSGNKATGNVISKKYILGIPVQTVKKSTTITCSATGTLS